METDICLAYGALIGVVVGFLKRIPFIRGNPKLTATFLSVLVAIFPVVIRGVDANLSAIIVCILTQLGSAVGTHEVILKTVKKNVFPGAKL